MTAHKLGVPDNAHDLFNHSEFGTIDLTGQAQQKKSWYEAAIKPRHENLVALWAIFEKCLGLTGGYETALEEAPAVFEKRFQQTDLTATKLKLAERERRTASATDVVLIAHEHDAKIGAAYAQDAIYAESVRSFMLYHSHKAALLWERITSRGQYRLFQRCQRALDAMLKNSVAQSGFQRAQIFFNFGAGSHAKDRLILAYLNDNQHISAPAYIWVEASLQMLDVTLSTVKVSTYPNVRLGALHADFENQGNVAALYGRAFPMYPKVAEKNKCIFILGFTLCNLKMSRFFENLKSTTKPGDTCVFPMQFVDESLMSASDAELRDSNFAKTLLECYVHDDGKEMSSVSISVKDGDELVQKPAEIKVAHRDDIGRSVFIEFSAQINRGGGQSPLHLVTHQSKRFFKNDFIQALARNSFDLVAEAVPSENDGVTMLMVQRT